MKILVEYIKEYSKEFEKLFDWYFHLTQIKRVYLNHMVLLVTLAYLTYKNDEQHRINNTILSDRLNTVNNIRSKEQKEHIKDLKFFTEKFSNLLEKSFQQKEEVKQIKEKQ